MKIVFLFALLFSISTLAQDKTFKTEDGKYLWLYGESSTWVLKSFEIIPGKLPIPLEIKYFDSEKRALDFAVASHRSIDQLSEREIQNISTVDTEVRGETLWKVENQWSWEWEKKYAEWVLANSDFDFLYNHNIATDCADSVLSYRWIFARIHKLPAAQSAYLVGGVISQDTMLKHWMAYPTDPDWEKDKRFFAALNYVHEVTNTSTLSKDSYPLELTREAFIPGFHYLRIYKDFGLGHSMISTGILDNSKIRFISSTMPRELRSLFEMFYEDDELIAPENGGLVRLVWPYHDGEKWQLTPKDKMPFYSLAQYSPELLENEIESYRIGMFKKLNMDIKIFDMFSDGLQSLTTKIYYRIYSVMDAQKICAVEDCSPGTANYDAYSTPSRDKKIYQLWEQLKKLRSQDTENESIYEEYWQTHYKPLLIVLNYKEDTYEPLEPSMLFTDILKVWEEHKYSTDPRDSLEKRWGIEP